MNIFSQDLARKFHEAAIRLFMKIGYEAHDSFAADIYYHPAILNLHWKKNEQTVNETVELFENDILEVVYLALKKRIVHEKDAFLLSNIVEDIQRLSELNEFTEQIISNTRTLKRRITGKFSDDISFYSKDKYLVVHSSNVNLCKYGLDILKD